MSKSIQMSRRRFLEVGGLAGVIASLAACGGGESGGGESGGDGGDAAAGGTLVLAIADEPTGMDIQQIDWENQAHNLIYEPLVGFTSDLSEVVPFFAESFEQSEDGLTLTYTLPADAKFSNGDPCDAAAVKASFERYVQVSPYATDFDEVESFEAVDDVTFVMHLKNPAPYMFASITSSYSGVVDVAVADTMSADEFNRAPVTVGAYYVDSWEQGNQMTLKRNEYFHTNNPELTNKEAPLFETIVMRFISDDFTRVTEVEDGDVHMAFNIPAASVVDLEANPDITLYGYGQPGSNFLYLNIDDGVLADLAARQAMFFAINRDEIADALDGVVTPMYGIISPAMSCYSQEEEDALAQKLAFDLDKAKQILADGGWEDTDGDGIVEKDGTPLSFELFVSSDRPAAAAAAPVLQQQLAAAGIDAQIREYEASYIKEMIRDNNYVCGWRNYDWIDPDLLYNGIFGTIGGYPWSGQETVDEMLEVARTITDQEERTAAYAEFQEWLSEQYKAIPLFYDNYSYASKVALTGVIVTNDGKYWLADASLA